MSLNMLKLVQRDDMVKECFISEKFIQSQEWGTYRIQPSCPVEIRKCKYYRDYIKYDGEKYCREITFFLRFSEIIHATHQSELLSIIKDGGFKPGQKNIPDCDINSFVWFGMKIGQAEVEKYTNYYTMICQMEKKNIFVNLGIRDIIDCRSIVNSPCFEPMSRYGDFKLAFEIQNVIKEYRQQFCLINSETRELPKPEFRILGTFVYKMEIMHTVLVCPPDTPGTSKYPLLNQETYVICEDPDKEGTFKWLPHSTGDKDKASENGKDRKPYRRWEHVTFAFYVPAGKILKLKDVSSNLSVCIYQNPKLYLQPPSSINFTIQTFLDKVSKESEIETKRWLINLLIRSLRGYLDEEKVFEKMNILYTYQPLYLGTVVNRVEKLLGEEFCWSQFIEWMKDVQQTKNADVLLSIFKYFNKMTKICTTKLEAMASYNN